MTTLTELHDPLVLQFASSRPEDIAAILAKSEIGEVADLITGLPPETAARLSTRLPSWQLTGLLGALDAAIICPMLLSAATDEAVAIVSHLSASKYANILEACPASKRRVLRQLFDYPSHTLATLVTTHFIRVKASTSCGTFADQLADSSDTRSRPVLVVDDNGKYRGMLGLQRIFSRRNRNRPVLEVMDSVEALSGITSADTALTSDLWASHSVLPVVDGRHRVLGVVGRASLLRVVGDDSPGEFDLERMLAELATGYIHTCGGLLEALLGNKR